VFKLIKSLHLPPPFFVIQAGAHEGQEIHIFARNSIATAILLEPIPTVFKRLCFLCSQFGFHAENFALDDREQVQQLFLASNDGMSSSLLQPMNHKIDYPHVLFRDSIEVNSIRGDSLLAKYPSTDKPKMLYMDTQGSELRILKGFGERLKEFDYIFTEVGIGNGYTDSPSVTDIITYLATHQFIIQDLYVNPEGWGDALFVSKDIISTRHAQK